MATLKDGKQVQTGGMPARPADILPPIVFPDPEPLQAGIVNPAGAGTGRVAARDPLMPLAAPVAPSPMPMVSKLGGGKPSVMDSIVTGLFGPSHAEMTEAEGKQADAKHAKNVNNQMAMAENARKNPGAAEMNGPVVTGGGGLGSDLMKLIGSIMKGG